VSYDDVDSRLN